MAPNTDPRTRLEQLFEQETAEFDLSYAFLSSIDLENETQRLEVVHGSHEMLKPDTTFPLSKTYCRKTIADPEGTMAISEASDEGWEDDPAYETLELESYLGTTVSVDDEFFGTLCFADTDARDDQLTEKEKAIIEMHGQWVEYLLTLWEELSIRETRLDTIEGRAVPSEAIDSMMDALRSRTRRVVLMTLLEDPTTSIATLERRVNHENGRLRLYHIHLPKLADAGYIQWDSDADTISKGPKFTEVEPLVHLLKEYNRGFSE
ncbi:DUF7344 domain-containing protein [Halobellus ordinarius]|uniref:DUF7344 domain-containing protein n=1 Tax=Halobellus ordinarius TaxID=3075120 RepID=UPI00288016B7|nr:hypothetical protein [Halobellus sp. ZY16]